MFGEKKFYKYVRTSHTDTRNTLLRFKVLKCMLHIEWDQEWERDPRLYRDNKWWSFLRSLIHTPAIESVSNRIFVLYARHNV